MDDETAKLIFLPLIGLMVIALGIGGYLVVRDTVRKRGRWGVNLKPLRCPACGEPAPGVRTPKNRRQAMWGGCTCANCGVEYDKWGHPVAAG